jgi:arylsulfatase A-like enzyme
MHWIAPLVRRFVIALAAAMPLACSTSSERPPLPRPNVVVVLIDTLRPDYLDAYGYPRSTAPFLAELASKSVVFERAFSTSSWTVPSVASLLTSAYPHQHGVVQGFMAYRKQLAGLERDERAKLKLQRLSASTPALPEILKKLGYSTYGIAANVNLGPELGFQRGFDKFYFEKGLSVRHVHRILETWKEELDRSKPVFAYLHLNDVHSPFVRRERHYQAPPSSSPRETTRAAYLSEIGFVDEYLARIYSLLGEDENTIFVFLSDHGEEFWDHGGTFHGATLYRELTRVLMMFSSPARGIEPRRVRANVSLIDVVPTLVDLVGGSADEGWQGCSLRPILEGGAGGATLERELRDRTLYAHLAPRGNARHRWAAIDSASYLIETESGAYELYDLSDAAQVNDVHTALPQRAGALTAALGGVKTEGIRPDAVPVEIEVDEELLQTLRSLGYVER